MLCNNPECWNLFEPIRSSIKYCSPRCKNKNKQLLAKERDPERYKRMEKARIVRYKEKHRDRINLAAKLKAKESRKSNPDYVLIAQRYRKTDRGIKAVNRSTTKQIQAKYSSQWKRKNPERARQHEQAYYYQNRDKAALKAHVRRARITGTKSTLTPDQWTEIKVFYNQECAYCHRKVYLTLDHVIPLSKGGSHTEDNVVPACSSCNSSKGDRDLANFLSDPNQDGRGVL